MDEQQNNEIEKTQVFTPDFGSTFDDYGEYQEPSVPAPVQEPKRKWHLKRIRFPRLIWAALFLAIAVGLGMLAAKWGWRWAQDVLALTRPDETVEVVINESDDLDDITATLKEAGAIEYEWLFKLYCKYSGSEDYFDPGIYKINLTYDYHALVNNLQESAGSRETITLMIVEGADSFEIFDLFEQTGVCSREKLEEAAANYEFDYEFLKDLRYGEANRLEGYLFPDTYEFYLKDDPEKVLNRLLRNFDARLSEEELEQVQNSGYTLREILTLASIVEAEAANDEERPKVASVMFNRLNNWSDPKLGMDSTVYYGAKLLGTTFSTELDSPYNTYLYPGLPAGPICNPGLVSIQAVLNPEDTDYYYFATGVDGVNHFFKDAASFQEFLNSDQYAPILPG